MQGRAVSRYGYPAHNSKTHFLWREQEYKAGCSAGMDIQLTRHNSKTHSLGREQECKAGQSAGMDIQLTIRRLTNCGENRNARQDSQQVWKFSSQFIDSQAVKRKGMQGRTVSIDGH